MTLIPPPKPPPTPPFYSSWIFILVVGIIIGLLIGWFVDFDKTYISEGTPTFSSYDTTTGVITLPPQSNKHYWVTSSLLGSANKGLTITPNPPGPIYTPHYNCTGGPMSAWNLPGTSSYQLRPLFDPALCTTSPPPPTAPLRVGAPHTLVTKTGTVGLINSAGSTVTCPIDVYTFTDASGNTSCITIILMDN